MKVKFCGDDHLHRKHTHTHTHTHTQMNHTVVVTRVGTHRADGWISFDQSFSSSVQVSQILWQKHNESNTVIYFSS